MQHPISAFLVPPSFVGEDKKNFAQEVVQQCVDLKSADIDTKAAREKTFKEAAKCAAEVACAVYSKGIVPPGVCSTIAGPVADAAIQVWNGVYSLFSADDAKERATLAAQVAVPQAYVQLKRLDLWFSAHYHNVIAGLIQFHDKELPDKKGALGSGGPKQTELVLTESSYNKAEYFPYLYYSDNKPAALALGAAGAPAASCGSGAWCEPPRLVKLYSEWAQSHATAGSIIQLQQLKAFASLHESWALALNKAALRVQADIVAEAVQRRLAEGNGTEPNGKPSRTPLIVGGVAIAVGGGLWWAWSKGLLKGIFG